MIFLKNHYYLDIKKQICGVYIRKNACSTFKKMALAHAAEGNFYSDNYIKSEGLSPLQIMKASLSLTLKQAISCRKRVFIIRDPVDRLISGYLNIFVLRLGRFPDSIPQKITGIELENMNFEGFINQYITLGFDEIDNHFAPLVSHLYPINYNYVMLDSELYNDALIVFGPQTAKQFFKRKMNNTSVFSTLSIPNPTKTPANKLYKFFQEQKKLPAKACFKTPNLISKINQLYKYDVQIYEKYMKDRIKNSNKPISVNMRKFNFSDVYHFDRTGLSKILRPHKKHPLKKISSKIASFFNCRKFCV